MEKGCKKNGKNIYVQFLEEWESSCFHASFKEIYSAYYNIIQWTNKCVSVFTDSEDNKYVVFSKLAFFNQNFMCIRQLLGG